MNITFLGVCTAIIVAFFWLTTIYSFDLMGFWAFLFICVFVVIVWVYLVYRGKFND